MVSRVFIKVLNVLLLVFFIFIIVNSTVMSFHLVSPLEHVKIVHGIVGWIFILLMIIHVILHLKYYKSIFVK